MKLNTLGLLVLIFLGLNSCQTDEVDTLDTEGTFITVNLETFIPSQELDHSPKGKYVGVMGHHTNPEIHGKVFINAGQHNQYNALVKLVNGGTLKFSGAPEVKDGSIVRFDGIDGSFRVNLQNFNETIQSAVTIYGEQTDGYVVLQKSTRSSTPFVLTGTYVDSNSPNFTGNWDLIGDAMTEIIDVDITMPITATISIPIQRMAELVITHSGSSAPLIDNTFEMNTGNTCFAGLVPGLTLPDEPVFIVENISTVLFGAPTSLGGTASLSAGGQTSFFNGELVTWNLIRNTPIAAPPLIDFPEMFFNEDCSPGTSGSWSWNGRSGTISITD